MANAFSKEERVAFEDILEGFNDALVLSKAVNKYTTDPQTMERTGNTIWRPQPYVALSVDGAPGTDISSLYKDYTQLSVPCTLSYNKSVPFKLTEYELRDAIQEKRLGEAARQKLASDINVAIMSKACNLGSLVVKRTTAASGFDDVAACDAIMNEQGVPNWDRNIALSSRDYNSAAGNLAARETLQGKPLTAYDRAYVGMVSGFDTYKLDYATRLTAAAGGGSITMDTRDTATTNFYTPKATSTAASTGEISNVDNRFHTIVVSSTTSVAVGDAFTIAGIESCHHITKTATGQLKTFRVTAVVDGTHLTITPPIISGAGATAAELEYQNCVASTKGATAAITWLNTVTAYANPFWQKGALEIMPGRYAARGDGGVNLIKGTTDNGVEVCMWKFEDINTLTYKYRIDTFFGVVNLQPEHSGIILFSQT